MQTFFSEHLIPDLEEIVALRHILHQNPELSGEEKQTATRIVNFMKKYEPDEIITGLGGTGVAIIFHGENPTGPNLLFRSELDAIPITESNINLPYSSVKEGISHKCGHEGHMAILTGLASLLRQQKLKCGKVILLFQPAEETGAGAWNVLQDRNFQQLKPDYVFALHNMPGLPLNRVLVREGIFSPASTGMAIEFFGKSSHAGEPENGVNPGIALSELIVALNGLSFDKSKFQDTALITITHARLGDATFGINPGYATVFATLRSFRQEDFELLKKMALETVEHTATKHNLKYTTRFVEEFPATVNEKDPVETVKKAAKELLLDVEIAQQPVKWSEDFGHFTIAFPGALFGLGAGLNHPSLHHSDYDFPDPLIPSGATLFYTVARHLTTYKIKTGN